MDGSATIHSGTPKRIFDYPAASYVAQNNIWTYAPHPDGQRFLVNALTKPDDQAVLTVVTNWRKALARPTP